MTVRSRTPENPTRAKYGKPSRGWPNSSTSRGRGPPSRTRTWRRARARARVLGNRPASLTPCRARPCRRDAPRGRGGARDTRAPGRVEFGDYVRADAEPAFRRRGGPRAQRRARHIPEGRFPLELLRARRAPGRNRRRRGANQGTWLDRLFDGTAAERLGISFASVADGCRGLSRDDLDGGAGPTGPRTGRGCRRPSRRP